MADYPKRVDRFKEWAKLMTEQAVVPDRPQYKSTSAAGSRPQRKARRRRKRRFTRRRKGQE